MTQDGNTIHVIFLRATAGLAEKRAKKIQSCSNTAKEKREKKKTSLAELRQQMRSGDLLAY